MKKLILISVLTLMPLVIGAQSANEDLLQNLENRQQSEQDETLTATMTSASRLFADRMDLTSVIVIIPSGTTVSLIDSDSTYYHVIFEESEGFIYKRHAVIDQNPAAVKQTYQTHQQQGKEERPVQQQQQISRFTYLENKYGSNMAARLLSGKIWKGMNSEMVKDSWGNAQKINRVISGNVIKEEWIYNNTWLYFENNTLKDWGPIQR